MEAFDRQLHSVHTTISTDIFFSYVSLLLVTTMLFFHVDFSCSLFHIPKKKISINFYW